MRPVKVSKAEADAILANARARGIAFPKPVPVKRDGIYKLKLRAQIRAVSAKARKRIGEWSALRDGVVARDSGVCQFCGGEHQKLTAHHVIPRANGGDDVETNLVTIGITVRGFGGCHASAHADLRSSKMILLRKLGHAYYVSTTCGHENEWGYVVEWSGAVLVRHERSFPDETTALARGLEAVQRDIEAGRRPSLLTREA